MSEHTNHLELAEMSSAEMALVQGGATTSSNKLVSFNSSSPGTLLPSDERYTYVFQGSPPGN